MARTRNERLRPRKGRISKDKFQQEKSQTNADLDFALTLPSEGPAGPLRLREVALHWNDRIHWANPKDKNFGLDENVEFDPSKKIKEPVFQPIRPPLKQK